MKAIFHKNRLRFTPVFDKFPEAHHPFLAGVDPDPAGMIIDQNEIPPHAKYHLSGGNPLKIYWRIAALGREILLVGDLRHSI